MLLRWVNWAVAAIMTWTAGARGPDACQNATWARDQCVKFRGSEAWQAATALVVNRRPAELEIWPLSPTETELLDPVHE